ncbi:MAG: hypothetical protein ACOY4R_26000 [Pseudomonadota bacterium]
MKRLALVSGHFAPSNLVGAHRARLWSRYLPDFGWEPIVVTGDPGRYEERPDPDVLRLVSPDLRVIHAWTFPTRPVRLVGDVGIRAFWGCYRALARLAARREIDFVLITIPSNFLAPVGRLIRCRYGVPYGIDYQDPWVARLTPGTAASAKAWLSHRLALILEPWSVRHAALVTGIAPGYVAGMLERNPEVAQKATIAYMAMGSEPEAYEMVRGLQRPPFLFTPADGRFHMLYAGALLPAGGGVLKAFLAGLRALRERAPGSADRLRVHFVGTGRSPDDPQGHQVRPLAAAAGVAEMVEEHPQRIGYLDVLNHLTSCDGVLILGSTEPHYSPSKVFQAVLSRRPVFALLHAQSTASDVIRASRAGTVLALTETTLPGPDTVADALEAFMQPGMHGAESVDSPAFEADTARASACALAAALDRALAGGAAGGTA